MKRLVTGGGSFSRNVQQRNGYGLCRMRIFTESCRQVTVRARVYGLKYQTPIRVLSSKPEPLDDGRTPGSITDPHLPTTRRSDARTPTESGTVADVSAEGVNSSSDSSSSHVSSSPPLRKQPTVERRPTGVDTVATMREEKQREQQQQQQQVGACYMLCGLFREAMDMGGSSRYSSISSTTIDSDHRGNPTLTSSSSDVDVNYANSMSGPADKSATVNPYNNDSSTSSTSNSNDDPEEEEEKIMDLWRPYTYLEGQIGRKKWVLDR
eukprot:jgi/Bigna1/139838/aug1.52_g14546